MTDAHIMPRSVLRRDSDLSAMQLAGLAGLVGGALSMACGEYISVSSQKDAEEVRAARAVLCVLLAVPHACMLGVHTMRCMRRSACWLLHMLPSARAAHATLCMQHPT